MIFDIISSKPTKDVVKTCSAVFEQYDSQLRDQWSCDFSGTAYRDCPWISTFEKIFSNKISSHIKRNLFAEVKNLSLHKNNWYNLVFRAINGFNREFEKLLLDLLSRKVIIGGNGVHENFSGFVRKTLSSDLKQFYPRRLFSDKWNISLKNVNHQ